jgi:CBS domain containing-hemolysin-like protein
MKPEDLNDTVETRPPQPLLSINKVDSGRLLLIFALVASPTFAFAAGGMPSGPPTEADPDAAAVTLLALYVGMAIGFSFLCSIAEAVLLSITQPYVEQIREQNPRRAQQLQKLKFDNIDRSLAAILTLNTIAHTVGAIGAGAQANVVFGSYWFGVFSAVMTLLILFASEIVPKTLGAVFWRQLVGPTLWYIRILIFLLYPVVWVSEILTKIFSFGHKGHEFSRDELDAMARVGHQSGGLGDKEAKVIRSLLRFGSLRAADIMTPRTVITALKEDLSLDEAAHVSMRYPFARIPVYDQQIDHITGFVMRYDIMLGNHKGQGEEPLSSIRREIPFFPHSATLSSLLESFFDGGHHIAIIVDEYGGVDGLVSMEDIIETLMGLEITDELDEFTDLQDLAREEWLQRAKSLGIVDEQQERPVA